nr:hypothetical protein [Tanacetum cinerariifolium]
MSSHSNGDFVFMMEDLETKMDIETPYEKLKDNGKTQLDKNNEAKMTLYNALPSSKTSKEKVKSFALKAKVIKEQTSDDSNSQGRSDEDVDEDEAKSFNMMARNFHMEEGHFIGEFPKPKENKDLSEELGAIAKTTINRKRTQHVSWKSTLKRCLAFNLISVEQLCDDDCVVKFTRVDCTISKNGKTLARGYMRNGLYTCKLGDNSMLWHRRLGHANMRLVQNTAFNELVRNLPKLRVERHFCDTCGLRNQGNVDNKTRNEVSTIRGLELLHLDFFGPSPTQSYRGNIYTLIIIDDHSNYTWVVFLKSKGDVLEKFRILCNKLENLHDCSIVLIVTNHSTECDKFKFGNFYEQHVKSNNLSGSFTSQSNEIVERIHRNLRKMSGAMLDGKFIYNNLQFSSE